MSDNSANEEIFMEAIPPYQAELERCGFAHKLEYRPGNTQETEKKKRTRTRKITWFNPPYSMDVETNVGKQFLDLLDQHFPPGHILHSVLNRSTVKVSYRCLPGMGAQVAKQNTKNINADKERVKPPPTCNCQRNLKGSCPIPGACNQKGVIYQATVTCDGGGQKSYIGLAAVFKKRFYKHKDSLQVKNPQNSTTLSTHFWNKTENGENPKVSWTIIESNIPTFNPVTKSCKLCLREKFDIVLNPHLATLNSRNEIFAHCRHMGSKLIDQKPD